MNYWKVLGLKEGATKDEITQARLKLSKLWHPDRNPGNKDAERKFKLIQEAYDKLLSSGSKSKPTTKTKVQEFVIQDGHAPQYDLWGNKLTNSQRQEWQRNLKTPIDKIHQVNRKNNLFKDSVVYYDEGIPEIR